MAEVKKPVGGAYGQFMNEKRPEFAKLAEEKGLKGVPAVAKLAGEAWKNCSEEERKVYEDKYAAAKEAWDSFKSSDQYVAPEPKQKRTSKGDGKPPKDKDAPKRPAGGAYGQFLAEKREEFTQQAKEKGMQGITAVTKLAGEAWKALSEDEKKPYNDSYAEAKAKFDEEKKAYDASKEAEKPSPEKTSPATKGRKRAAESQAAAPAQKRGRAAAKKAAPEPEIDAKVLAEAEGLKMKNELLNLAGREEVVAKGFESNRLLQALKDSAGLVNKAKAALLGA